MGSRIHRPLLIPGTGTLYPENQRDAADPHGVRAGLLRVPAHCAGHPGALPLLPGNFWRQ